MHTIFQCARRWELVEKNPIELVRVRGGSKRLRTPRILTPEEFCFLPPLIAEPYRPQVWIAGCLGLRASEIMPLQWPDLDLEDRSLLIQRSMVHGKGDDVKTEYSRDRVPLDPALMEILLEHRERYHRTEQDWMFANPKTNRPYHQDTIQQNQSAKPAKPLVLEMASAGTPSGTATGPGWMTRARR
jgi:integrase